MLFRSHQWRDLVEVCLFVLTMSLALVYAWRMGVFRAGRLESAVAEEPSLAPEKVDA